MRVPDCFESIKKYEEEKSPGDFKLPNAGKLFSEKKGTTQSKLDGFLGPRVMGSKSEVPGFGDLSLHAALGGPKPAGLSLAAAVQGLATEEVTRKRDQKALDKLESETAKSGASKATGKSFGNALKGQPGATF